MAHITVKGPGTDHKVILWEKDDAHPTPKGSDKGEVLIVNDDQEYKVGETPAIKRLILEGRLVKVEGKASAKTDAKKADGKPTPPWDGYDNASPQEVLAKLKDSTEEQRKVVLDYERANKKRDTVILPLVNWNS